MSAARCEPVSAVRAFEAPGGTRCEPVSAVRWAPVSAVLCDRVSEVAPDAASGARCEPVSPVRCEPVSAVRAFEAPGGTRCEPVSAMLCDRVSVGAPDAPRGTRCDPVSAPCCNPVSEVRFDNPALAGDSQGRVGSCASLRCEPVSDDEPADRSRAASMRARAAAPGRRDEREPSSAELSEDRRRTESELDEGAKSSLRRPRRSALDLRSRLSGVQTYGFECASLAVVSLAREAADFAAAASAAATTAADPVGVAGDTFSKS